MEIAALVSLDYDIDVLGFESDELAELLAQPTVGLVDPDEVPEVPAEPVTQPGDKWHLGNHRLLCGDCDQTDRRRPPDGWRARHSDGHRSALSGRLRRRQPPPTWANGGKQPGALRRAPPSTGTTTSTTTRRSTFYQDFLSVAVEQALTKTPVIYMFFGMMRAPLVFEAWQKAGLLLHQVLVWNKSRIVLWRSDYCWNYEPIAYGWIKGRDRGRHGGRRPTPRRSGRSPRRSSTAGGASHLQAGRAHPPARSTTTPRPASSSTSPSAVRARRSSPPR